MPAPIRLPVPSRDERLAASLRARRVHPSLHYETDVQARKWLALHQRYSPAVTSTDTTNLYEACARRVAEGFAPGPVQVVSLGCGGGNKDFPLLRALGGRGCAVHYVPCDISERLAREAASGGEAVAARCEPIVCDLEHSGELAAHLVPSLSSGRIVLFFGILPNMESSTAAECLVPLLRPGDRLLLGANLAADARSVLPQYDNPETRDWLLTLPRDLGLAAHDGELRFEVRDVNGWPRIVAVYEFSRDARLSAGGMRFDFRAGDTLDLFFSNRHTPALVADWLGGLGLTADGQWINARGDEGIFSGTRLP